MNSIDRITAAINFHRLDRPPVVAQVFGHAAVLAEVPLCDYLRDGEALAGCQIKAQAYYGHDAVFALMDANVETEAVGSSLKYTFNGYPSVSSYALSDLSELEDLPPPDPYGAGRMPELLKAARILRRKVGDSVVVVGCVLGPMTLATQLLGMEAALYTAIDTPDRFALLLDYATDIAVNFGIAQVEAGVHIPLVFDPAASPAVVPHQFFREMLVPRLQKVFAAFKQTEATGVWLHIAGPCGPILHFYPMLGIDVANIDYEVRPSQAREILPGTCLSGNIRPLAFVEDSAEAIADNAHGLIRLFADSGGFILSSGCEIPLESRPENVAAMVAASTEKG